MAVNLSTYILTGGSLIANDAYSLVSSAANSAYSQSNTALVFANSAYSQSNTALVFANSAYNQANTGLTLANSAYNQANTALNLANSAYNKANTSAYSTTDDLSTSATYYPTFVTTANGTVTKTSSTKLTFDPSTGTLSSTIYNSLSDIKFKENITQLVNALEYIDKINPVSFTWKDNGNKAFGVIAQEIEKIIPEIVTTNDTGIKTVSYDQLIPFLLQSIKELKKEIEVLKEMVTDKNQ